MSAHPDDDGPRDRGDRWLPGGFGDLGARGEGPRGISARARRGDVRAAILVLLEEQPMHGYQILRELAERTSGAWKPSPGSVYPALSLLEAQGLVSGEEAEGKRVFALTPDGLDKASEEEREPWKAFVGPQDDRMGPVRDALDGLISVAKLVAHKGTTEQVGETVEILVEARRRLYRMMADAD